MKFIRHLLYTIAFSLGIHAIEAQQAAPLAPAMNQQAIAAWDKAAIQDAAAADAQAQQMGNTGDLDVSGALDGSDIAADVGDMPDDLSELDKLFPPDSKYAMVQEFPVIGRIGFTQDAQGNMVAEIADENRKLIIGPLTFDYAQFLYKEGKLGLTARGDLFGKKARIGIKNLDYENKALTLSVEFIAKPTISVIPGMILRLDEVDITMSKGKKPTIFTLFTTIAGKQFQIDYTKVKKGVSNIAATLPSITIGELIHPAADTPLGDIALTDIKLESLGATKGKASTYKISATADLGSLLGGSSEETRGVAVEIEINKDKGRTLTATLSGIKIPDFGEIKEAKLVGNFPKKKPSTITITGTTIVSVPDIGDLTVELSANLAGTKKGTAYTLSGDVKQEVSVADGQVHIKNIHAAYTPKIKKEPQKWEFSGDANVVGINAKADIIKTPKKTTANFIIDVGFGPITTQLEVLKPKGGNIIRLTGTIEPDKLPSDLTAAATEFGLTNFKVMYLSRDYKEGKVIFPKGVTIEADAKNLTLPGDITLNNLHALYNQKTKKFEIVGDADLFGLTLQADLTKGPKGFTGSLGADLGTLDLNDWISKMPSPLKDAFTPVEKLMSLKMNHVKVAANISGEKPTLTISAEDMTVSGIVGDVLDKLGVTSGLKPNIIIPLTNPLNFDIKFAKLINAGIANLLKLTSLDFDLKGALPFPKLAFDFNGEVTLPGMSPREVMLSVNTEEGPGNFAFEGGIKGGAINHPLGFPIELDDPYLKINFAAGELSGFGLNGHFKMGDMDVTGFVDINIGAPQSSAVDFNIKKLCLTDMISMQYKLAAMAASKVSGINLNLPSTLICMRDVTGKWAILPVTKPTGETIMPGITLKGSLDFELPGLPPLTGGNMEVAIDPLGTRMVFDGRLAAPIKLGPIFQITAADNENEAPYIHGEISRSKQEFRIDGLINFAGFMKSKTDMTISPQGLAYAAESILFGISTKVGAKIPLPHVEDSTFNWSMSAPDIQNLVRGPILDNLNVAKREISAFTDKANSALNDAENKCGDIPVASDICKAPMEIAKQTVRGFEETIKGLTKAVDVLSDKVLGTFQMESLSIAGAAKSVVPGGPPVTVELGLKVLSKDYDWSLNINMPSPNDAGKFFQMIGETIFDKAIKPAVNAIKEEAERAYDRAKDAINAIKDGALSAARAVQYAAEEVAHAGEVAANAVKNAGETAINGVKDTSNTIAHGAEDAANAVASTATKAVNTVGDAAKTAVNAVGDVAKDAVNKIGDAAQEAGHAIEHAGEAAANWAAGAAGTVGHGLEQAGDAVGHAFNPTNW